MTKKDYILISGILRFYQIKVTASQDDYAVKTIDDLINDFAFDLGKENPRFDRTKFLKACGLLA